MIASDLQSKSGEDREAPARPSARTVVKIAWSVALLLGLAEAFLARNEMYSDGVSYLDISDALLRGDWRGALNGYWSPLYPALLAAARAVLAPSAYWEFAAVHVVNFLVYVCALAGFHYFWTGLSGYQRARRGFAFPQPAWMAFGYALFLWSSLKVITVAVVSPDLCVAAFVYLLAGVVLRIGAGASGWRKFAVLGALVGLGYLAKAPLLPLGLVFIAAALAASWMDRRAVLWAGMALLGLLVVAGPFGTALSLEKGRPTFGDSWKLNYAWYVDLLPRYHWQGGRPVAGVALHPPRKIHEAPPVYEFRGRPGTYPVWYDPSFWHEGLQLVSNWKALPRQVLTAGFQYYDLFFHRQAALVLGCLLLFAMSRRGRLRALVGRWILLVPAAAAFGLYALVHVEDRMVGAFLVLLWAGIFSAAPLADTRESHKLATRLLWSMAFLLFAVTALSTAGEAASYSPRELLDWRNPARHTQWQIAEGIRRAGLEPGNEVAWIRPHPFTARQNYWWARLARLRIVAEVPAGFENSFWTAPAAAQDAALDALSGAGVRALIATRLPVCCTAPGWSRVPDTDYWVRLLPRPSAAGSPR